MMSSKEKAISGEPKVMVKNLHIDCTYSATVISPTAVWDYPKSATDKKKGNRFQGVYVKLYCDIDESDSKVVSSSVSVRGGAKFNKNKKLAKDKSKGKSAKSNKLTGVQLFRPAMTNGKLTPEYFDKNTSTKNVGISFSTNQFYPEYPRYLDSVVAEVQGYNTASNTRDKKGSKKNGNKGWKKDIPTAKSVLDFYKPVAPELTHTYDPYTRTCVITQVSNDDGSRHHRRWTVISYKITKTTSDSKVIEIVPNRAYTEDTAQTNVVSYALTMVDGNHTIAVDDWIVMHVEAMAQGVRGDSKNSIKEYVFAYPYDPASPSVEGSKDSDVLFIKFGVNGTRRRSDYYRLQVLKDFFPPSNKIFSSDDVWRNLARDALGWDNVGEKVGPDVRGFVRNYRTDAPTASNPYARTYYRVISGNEIFDAMDSYRFGDPKEHPEYKHVPSARNEKVDFLEVTPEADGVSVRITLAYTIGAHDGSDEITETDASAGGSDGTEVSWSTDPYAWQSNQGPETFDMPDKDILGELWFRNPTTKEDGSPNDDQWLTTDAEKLAELKAKYEYTSTAYIRGLSEGTAYYFQARRYLEAVGDLPRTYGKYSSYVAPGSGDGMSAVTPSTKPKTVTAKVPLAIPIGKDLEVSWTFDSEGTQSKWKIYGCQESQLTYKPNPSKTTEMEPWIDITSTSDVATPIAEGTDSSGYALIPYETVTKDDGSVTLGVKDLLVDNTIWIAVAMATTGDWAYSKAVCVKYVSAPKAYLGVPETVTAQPCSLTIGTNDNESVAILRITAVNESNHEFPDKIDAQPASSVVYSKKYEKTELDWQVYNALTTQDETVYYTNIQLPRGLELYQSQTYQASLTIINETNKLDSLIANSAGAKEPQTAEFKVAYSRPVNPPSRKCYVTSDKESLTATIHLASTEENSLGDLCDIYRVTPDGAVLIASDVSYGMEVLDQFAPYSKTALTRYRIATKTPDGQVEWDDYAYNLKYHAIRFDWSDPTIDTRGYTSLTVPYNLDYSDKYKKSFESRHHFGKMRPSGYWDVGVDRTGSISTPMVKYDDPLDKEALRSLAVYSGPVMVRRPDGCAYLANVEVNNIKDTYNTPIITVSFEISEIDLTPHFMASTDNSYLSEADDVYLRQLNDVPQNFQSSPMYTLVPQVPIEPAS